MGLFKKTESGGFVVNTPKAFDDMEQNRAFAEVIHMFMEAAAEYDSIAKEYMMEAESAKENGFVNYVKNLNDVRSEQNRMQVNAVVKNLFNVPECFELDEWQTMTPQRVANRIVDAVVEYYVNQFGNSGGVEYNKIYIAMMNCIRR